MTRGLSQLVVATCASFLLAKPLLAVDCQQGFPYEGGGYGLARVVGAPRSYFHAAAPPCPDGDGCRLASYVVPGDTVLTGPADGSALCVLYPGAKRTVFGTLLRTDLGSPELAEARPPLSAWAGAWKNGDNGITLRPEGASLVASGDAYWPSANPSLKERPGGPNIGDMSGRAEPHGNVVTFGTDVQFECRVTLTLVSPYLLASDNGNCGGHNVSFTGLYRRTR